jgi:dsRNA-specific ribonuclease
MRAQAKQDEEATRQEESQPPAYVDKTLALLAAIMLDDPEEKRAALRDAGFPEDHLG